MNPDTEFDDLRDEYDFSACVLGKHYQAYSEGNNVVFLDPDIAKAFPNDAAVNKALRYLLEIVETSNHLVARGAQ